jgi:hypothetical protein
MRSSQSRRGESVTRRSLYWSYFEKDDSAIATVDITGTLAVPYNSGQNVGRVFGCNAVDQDRVMLSSFTMMAAICSGT